MHRSLSSLVRRTFTACLFLFSACTMNAQQQKSAPGLNVFRASVVKVNICPQTPKILLGYDPRLSTGIHDSIYHRILILDDGVTRFVLVSSDICEISPSLYDRVALRLQKTSGIDRINFWWSVTHTHSAPEVGEPGLDEIFLGDRYQHEIDTVYTHFIEQSLIDGIGNAIMKLEPARIGAGWGFSKANINRRAIDVDGKATLGLNPDGPTDRRIGIIRIERRDKSLLALICNYAIHGTVLGEAQTEISGDVPGIVSEYVEQKSGVPLLFINGAAGDLAPIYSVYPSVESGHLNQFRVLLGDKILAAVNTIRHTADSVILFSGEIMVESPRKEGMGWPTYLQEYSRSTAKGLKLVRLPVRFLRINNDIAIWSTPLELFCEISNDIRDHSPFPFTFYYGYTNGWLGYLPSADQFKYGGYETEVTPYTPLTQGYLKEAVIGYLQGELKSILKH